MAGGALEEGGLREAVAVDDVDVGLGVDVGGTVFSGVRERERQGERERERERRGYEPFALHVPIQ